MWIVLPPPLLLCGVFASLVKNYDRDQLPHMAIWTWLIHFSHPDLAGQILHPTSKVGSSDHTLLDLDRRKLCKARDLTMYPAKHQTSCPLCRGKRAGVNVSRNRPAFVFPFLLTVNPFFGSQCSYPRVLGYPPHFQTGTNGTGGSPR
jgi:hypothetical protein